MAQVKLLKIGSTGIPLEMDASADDITLNSFTIQGGGPVLSGTGLDLNNQDVSDIKDVSFNDSSTATIAINSTTYVADNMMFETKENAMTTAGAVLFPVVTDDADELDAFRLPAIAGVPSATPSDGGEGYLAWDSSNNNLYVWNGAEWDNLSTVTSAENIDLSYTADEALTVTNALYLSAADNVSKAANSSDASSRLLGFATESVSDTDPVIVRKAGTLGGFSGLTPGARQFLGTAGAITETVPVAAGSIVVQAGYAKNATTLDIQILQLGKRAA